MTTPYTAEILAPSLRDAQALAARLEKLPEVSQVITAASFIPADQDKLAILADLRLLIGPTLTPETTLPAPTDREILTAMAGRAMACGRWRSAKRSRRGIGQPGGAPCARSRWSRGARHGDRPGNAARSDDRTGAAARHTARRHRPRPVTLKTSRRSCSVPGSLRTAAPAFRSFRRWTRAITKR